MTARRFTRMVMVESIPCRLTISLVPLEFQPLKTMDDDLIRDVMNDMALSITEEMEDEAHKELLIDVKKLAKEHGISK